MIYIIEQRQELCLRDTNLCQRIQEIYLLCKRYGFHVKDIRSEKQFKKALEMFRDDQLQKYQTVIKINIANTKEHVPHAERNNRTMQDRTRCDYVNMPCTIYLEL